MTNSLSACSPILTSSLPWAASQMTHVLHPGGGVQLQSSAHSKGTFIFLPWKKISLPEFIAFSLLGSAAAICSHRSKETDREGGQRTWVRISCRAPLPLFYFSHSRIPLQIVEATLALCHRGCPILRQVRNHRMCEIVGGGGGSWLEISQFHHHPDCCLPLAMAYLPVWVTFCGSIPGQLLLFAVASQNGHWPMWCPKGMCAIAHVFM